MRESGRERRFGVRWTEVPGWEVDVDEVWMWTWMMRSLPVVQAARVYHVRSTYRRMGKTQGICAPAPGPASPPQHQLSASQRQTPAGGPPGLRATVSGARGARGAHLDRGLGWAAGVEGITSGHLTTIVARKY